MKAISTTYRGATDTLPGRLIAREPDGKRLTMPYPVDMDPEQAHRAAAGALRDRLGWKGELVAGWTGKGYVFVFVKEPRDMATMTAGEGRAIVRGIQRDCAEFVAEHPD